MIGNNRMGEAMLDPARIDEPGLARLYRYWHAKRSSDRPPVKAAIDPIEIPDLIKNLAFLDLDCERDDFVFTLAGSGIEDMVGRSLRGVYLSEIVAEAHQEQTRARFRAVIETRAPHYCRCSLEYLGRPRRASRRLLLPLSRDGREADSLLFASVVQPEDTREPS